ncbi:MAG: hypothetical protein FJW30_09625 [Acidobacteria bacterium]|nr:hypothetical protein [Acidobacteriota bacterium]
MTSLVRGLFVASAMLSVVSWYTTFEGMSLYLNRWFALLASLGVQASLLLVAWMMGSTRKRRGVLIGVYLITAVVSIAFSYVSLYRWFAERERPGIARRALYDELLTTAAKMDETLSAAAAEARKHVAALEEMTRAEKQHGHISRAVDDDPYLRRIREAVAREGEGLREGTGVGPRYSAFERYTRLARETQQTIEHSRESIRAWRAAAKPDETTPKQLQSFHTVFDAVPWNEVNDTLHGAGSAKPATPALAANIDQTTSGQEDLLLSFEELLTAPTSRHAFSFVLAAFIDVIIFLVALAAGPHMEGSPVGHVANAAAALESLDGQVFTRDLLRKVRPSAGGLGRIDAHDLSPGEAQMLLVLVARGAATQVDNEDGAYWLLTPETHAAMIESLAVRGVPLRASRAATA